jgi:hypothetical protein
VEDHDYHSGMDRWTYEMTMSGILVSETMFCAIVVVRGGYHNDRSGFVYASWNFSCWPLQLNDSRQA